MIIIAPAAAFMCKEMFYDVIRCVSPLEAPCQVTLMRSYRSTSMSAVKPDLQADDTDVGVFSVWFALRTAPQESASTCIFADFVLIQYSGIGSWSTLAC